jgi:magnesium-transporting ATPase (P-type)
MRSTVATLSARVGIAALVSLGVFAVPGGPASAAPSQTGAAVHTSVAAALTPAECTALQQQIDGLNARVLTLQDLLAEASPSQKAAIIRMIRKLEAQIGVLEAQYAAGCPA